MMPSLDLKSGPPAGEAASETRAGPPAGEAAAAESGARDFHGFLIGPSNSLAAAAVRENAFPLVFIAGAGPFGKSRLLEALARDLSERGRPFMAGSAVDFMEDCRTGDDGLSPRRRPWLESPLIIIDDVEFLEESRPAQNFLIQLIDRQKNLVVSSRRPPFDLTSLAEPLRSRLSGGLLLKLEAPDYDLAMAVLASDCDRLGLVLGEEILQNIFTRSGGDLRRLKGALASLAFTAARSERPVSLDKAALALFPEKGGRAENVPVELIVAEVAEAFALKPADLTGPGRTRQVAWPRRLLMQLARELTSLTTTEIGAALGGRDHSTVIHALKTIKTELKNPSRAKMLANIRASILSSLD